MISSEHTQPTRSAGFSLVETLVAISILLVVTSGIMLLVHRTIDSGQDISNRLVASYLASDAVEYVRASRDSYWLSDSDNTLDDWVREDILKTGRNCGNDDCEVDTRIGADDPAINPCGDCRLEYDEGSNLYGHDVSGGTDSEFDRRLNVVDTRQESGEYQEVTIAVTVTWTQAGETDGQLTVTDTLTAWTE